MSRADRINEVQAGIIDHAYRIACLVRLNTGTGRRPFGPDGKISARAYAREMMISQTTVANYLKAWDIAAERNGLPISDVLRPANVGDNCEISEKMRRDFAEALRDVRTGMVMPPKQSCPEMIVSRSYADLPPLPQPKWRPRRGSRWDQPTLRPNDLHTGSTFCVPNRDDELIEYVVTNEPVLILDPRLRPNSYSKRVFLMRVRKASETEDYEILMERTQSLEWVPTTPSLPSIDYSGLL